MARKKAAAAEINDLLGDAAQAPAASDDLVGDATPSKTKKSKTSKPKAEAKPAKASKPKAEKKAAAERNTRGTGKFYFPVDSDEHKTLRTAALRLKSATSTAEFAEKHEVPTWQARLVFSTLTKEGRGKLKKQGEARALVYTPA